jgi:hypothetical protein
MKIFEWLENTQMALMVGESLWAYPFLLSLHVIGLAIVVGIFIMLDLRLLGSFKDIKVPAFLSLMKLAWIGFIVNAISGAFLFTSQATTFVQSTPFLLKIAMIFIGAIMAAIIQTKLREMRDNDSMMISGTTKIIAIVSLTSWLGAIITGRLIAYIY